MTTPRTTGDRLFIALLVVLFLASIIIAVTATTANANRAALTAVARCVDGASRVDVTLTSDEIERGRVVSSTPGGLFEGVTFDGPGSASRVRRTWAGDPAFTLEVVIVWTPYGRPGPNFVARSTSRVTVEPAECEPVSPEPEIQTRERTEVDCAATFRRVLTEVREQTFKQDKTGAWVAAGWLPWEITDTRAEPLEPGDCESIDFPVWTVEHCWGTQTWTNRGNGDRLVETVPKRDANCGPDETSVEEGF